MSQSLRQNDSHGVKKINVPRNIERHLGQGYCQGFFPMKIVRHAIFSDDNRDVRRSGHNGWSLFDSLSVMVLVLVGATFQHQLGRGNPEHLWQEDHVLLPDRF